MSIFDLIPDGETAERDGDIDIETFLEELRAVTDAFADEADDNVMRNRQEWIEKFIEMVTKAGG